MRDAFSFLLDEDVHPEAATVLGGLGLDAVSVHRLGRTGASDMEQFDAAITMGRILVTRNRDDFVNLATAAFGTNRAFPGVLVVPRSVPNHRPERIAHAVARWATRYEGPKDVGDSFVDFVG